jgi:nitrite reductase/ring-hydroxylating ferredoxin subunit
LRIPACRRSELAQGQACVVALPTQANGLPQEAIVVVDQRGAVRAYINRCQHLPIPLDGGSRQFFTEDGRFLICGTHGALYRIDDGICVAGPCDGRALEALALEFEADAVFVVFESPRVQ